MHLSANAPPMSAFSSFYMANGGTFSTLWNEGVDQHEELTGVDLLNASNSVVKHLKHCDSDQAVLDALEKTAQSFKT